MFDGLAGTGAAARVALVRARSADALSPDTLSTLAEPFSLIVDLSAEPVGRRWARGFVHRPGSVDRGHVNSPSSDKKGRPETAGRMRPAERRLFLVDVRTLPPGD